MIEDHQTRGLVLLFMLHGSTQLSIVCTVYLLRKNYVQTTYSPTYTMVGKVSC
jgi:hypothetical protein